MASTRFAEAAAEAAVAAVAHVRYAGRSFDVPLAGLGLAGGASGDEQVKRALAAYLEVTPAELGEYVLDRHANGNVTLRPAAVFG